MILWMRKEEATIKGDKIEIVEEDDGGQEIEKSIRMLEMILKIPMMRTLPLLLLSKSSLISTVITEAREGLSPAYKIEKVNIKRGEELLQVKDQVQEPISREEEEKEKQIQIPN